MFPANSLSVQEHCNHITSSTALQSPIWDEQPRWAQRSRCQLYGSMVNVPVSYSSIRFTSLEMVSVFVSCGYLWWVQVGRSAGNRMRLSTVFANTDITCTERVKELFKPQVRRLEVSLISVTPEMMQDQDGHSSWSNLTLLASATSCSSLEPETGSQSKTFLTHLTNASPTDYLDLQNSGMDIFEDPVQPLPDKS